MISNTEICIKYCFSETEVIFLPFNSWDVRSFPQFPPPSPPQCPPSSLHYNTSSPSLPPPTFFLYLNVPFYRIHNICSPNFSLLINLFSQHWHQTPPSPCSTISSPPSPSPSFKSTSPANMPSTHSISHIRMITQVLLFMKDVTAPDPANYLCCTCWSA